QESLFKLATCPSRYGLVGPTIRFHERVSSTNTSRRLERDCRQSLHNPIRTDALRGLFRLCMTTCYFRESKARFLSLSIEETVIRPQATRHLITSQQGKRLFKRPQTTRDAIYPRLNSADFSRSPAWRRHY